MKPRFPQYKRTNEPEFKILRREVKLLVKRTASQKRKVILFKSILFPLLYVGSYLLLLIAGNDPTIFFVSYFLMGMFLVMNFLNLIHDAVHGVLFKSKWLNQAYLYFFDLLGANSYIWKIRHIRLHHSFPNIMDWDSDFEQSPLVRVFPQSPAKRFHKYQHIYLPFLYPLYLFNWLVVRDFKDFFGKDKLVHKVAPIPVKEYVKLFFFKVIFFCYTLLIPKLVLDLGWKAIIIGWILMILTASIFSLVVLLSPHANVESEFPNLDEKGQVPHSWFIHQLKCTNDISNDNFFIRFFMGSFNYHIAHHLFPDVHHSFYPEISKLLESYSKEWDLPYRKHSLSDSLMAHYVLLRRNASTIDLFEETM